MNLATSEIQTSPRPPKFLNHPQNQSLKGISVLMIEDCEDTRHLYAHILQSLGASVFGCNSASEAWSVLKDAAPDVIICDIAMPIENGISFIRKLRISKVQKLSSIPAIALTAFTDSEIKSLAITSGFQDFLSKPVSISDIVAMILRLTSNRGPILH